MARRKFRNGMVVWATVPDRNGTIKPEPRPLLITSVHPTEKRAPFIANCISTRPPGGPDDPVIEMPWDARTGGGVGLYRWCAVVLRWLVIVPPGDVVDVTGQVEAEFLDRVRQAVRNAKP